MKLLAALGAGLIILTGLVLILLWPWAASEGKTDLQVPMVTLLAIAALVYFLAVRRVLRTGLPRHAVWIVLIVAAAMRLPVLFTPPILSSDVYRYVWDGRVQAAGINPYLYLPVDPALADLRDTVIYPHINRADYAPTIYPPAAQLVFAAIAQISRTVRAEKLFMLGFEALAVFCALRLLDLARLGRERVLIYAWNPLTIWSFACDGHIDAASIALLSAALLLRCRLRDGLAGTLFGAAVLIKFLPVVVGPALWRRGAGWRLAAGAASTMAALYAIYAGAGWRVLGYLSGYRTEEHLDSGSGIWFLAGLQRLADLPPEATTIYAATVLLLLAALALWIMARNRQTPGTPADVATVCGHAAILATCVTVAISPHYPWYFTWLALPAVVRPYRSVIWLSAAPVLLYMNPFHSEFTWPSLVYIPAAILAFSDFHRVRRPVTLPAAPSLQGIP